MSCVRSIESFHRKLCAKIVLLHIYEHQYVVFSLVKQRWFLKTGQSMASEQSTNIATDFEVLAEGDVPGASVTNKDDDSSTTTKRCRDSLWKGQYCCVPLCHHSSGESVERKLLSSGRISFHSFLNLSWASINKERTTTTSQKAAI